MDYQEAIYCMKVMADEEVCEDCNYYQLCDHTKQADMARIAISAMQELQLYKDSKLCLIPEDVYSKQCNELDAYKQLGNLEEVREAVKRNKEKKVIEMVHGRHGIFDMGKSYNCPMCGSGLRYRYSVCEPIDNYCAICGQKIDCSEEDD